MSNFVGRTKIKKICLNMRDGESINIDTVLNYIKRVISKLNIHPKRARTTYKSNLDFLNRDF